MQRYQVCTVFLFILFRIHVNDAEWMRKYDESYHRPTYYNRAHSSGQHVDYNRGELDSRGVTTRQPPVRMAAFDPKIHTSYYVHVLYKGSVICAGALISRRMIITSSRCFVPGKAEPTQEYKAEDMSIITGKDFVPDRRKTANVIAFFMPAKKKKADAVHDVALLALGEKLTRGEYRYIPLGKRMPLPGSEVTMSYVFPASQEITLHKTKVVNITICKESYEEYGKLKIPFDEEFFCVANRKKAGCSTRPGDPLIVNNTLAGINIYGEHCDELEGSRKVDVYYSIRHTIKFIQLATDLLRGFTGTGPFNDSLTTKRTRLFQETTTAPPSLNFD